MPPATSKQKNVPPYSLIRYPGSKAKLFTKIRDSLPFNLEFELWAAEVQDVSCYCEPFFGSGAIGWRLFPSLIRLINKVVVNDLDPGIHALWLAIRDVPTELMQLISSFKPSPDYFYKFKEQDGDRRLDPVVLGFQKLALHQMSYSGMGFKSGGPLGGRKQKSEYNTSCRWNPTRIRARIVSCHKLMKSFRNFEVLNLDFEDVLKSIPADSFVYLDPPYFKQGPSLYRYPFSEPDHVRLSELLRVAKFKWILSYDDCPSIRSLYPWAHVRDFRMTPTSQTQRRKNGEAQKRRKNSEIVICNYSC